jgi:outer membrane receptor for ferrienterochelin and colicins
MVMKKIVFSICTCLFVVVSWAQSGSISGKVSAEGKGVEAASITIGTTSYGAVTDSAGQFEIRNLPVGKYSLTISSSGYHVHTQRISIQDSAVLVLSILLNSKEPSQLNEVVITGTMKEISRAESPVPVEIITPKLFQKNPTPSLFEAVGLLNGVQPQLNCNVCNTGDIHINGMEGPYTLVLIDGMPIVSALSTVYGLNGIPNSLVERIEVVKGPASSLYGSEALGGIINVITKSPAKAPRFSVDVFGTSWGELSADAAMKYKIGRTTNLLGINYFHYQNPVDNNGDNFTDLTLQKRISIFNKWSLDRSDNRIASLAARYVYEDRWGGEMQWNKSRRGSNVIYGETIYTKRAELIGLYQLPVKERIYTQFSYNWHQQNSFYGVTPYNATQQVTFVQTYWDKPLSKDHSALIGASFRYTFYDDNTPGTASPNGLVNRPAKTPLPGIFLQDEWTITSKHKLLLGYRFDYDKHHGAVHSPRFAYKFSPDRNNTMRASFGTGFRVVNLFTEDHAALTGAREIVIAEALNPERSYNANLNYVLKIPGNSGHFGFDVTGFYSYFTNKIIGDFDTDPNKIIYDNLKGHAVSQGVSLNGDFVFTFPLKLLAGITYMDVYQVEERLNKKEKSRQLHAPEWSGTFIGSYALPKKITVDVTGKWNGPMRLPILPNDYRPEFSPAFCIMNLQLTKKFSNGMELYGGVKNVFDFVPVDPIMRAFDPFDKTAGDPVTNPNGYTFDPNYNYASLQGRRGFAGMRWNLF